MPVQITINGENAEQAIQELAALSAGIANQKVPTVSVTAEEAPKADKPAKVRTKPETVKEPPAASLELQDDEPDLGDDSDVTDEPIPTVVELRAKAQEIGKTPEGKKAIKDLLNQFGSKSISDIPENKRAAFMRALEELA